MIATAAFRWTDEAVQQLQELCRSNLNARQIAEKLGCTRLAVIGKLNRERIKQERIKEGTWIEPPRRSTKKVNPIRQPLVRSDVFLSADQAPLPDNANPVDWYGLRQSHCRWPLGEIHGDDFRFCGAPRDTRSYCSFHAALAYKSE